MHAQTLALYALVDEIKAAHPGLEIESCASGGARVDLGVLEHTDRVWVSDCIDPLERQQMNRWTGQLVPLELMGTHIASGRSHTTGRVHDLGFRAAAAVFGHLGIEWDLARASEEELEQLREWVRFFKSERELLLSGRLVRLDFPDETLIAQGVVARDKGFGLYSFACVGRSEVTSPGRWRLPGLDKNRRYRVSIVDVGPPASGLVRPLWALDHRNVGGEEVHAAHSGSVLSGITLGTVGLMSAPVHPDQIVLVRATAVSSSVASA